MRNELAKRVPLAKQNLEGRDLGYILAEKTLGEVGKIIPRLKLNETSRIYPSSPRLFVGFNETDMVCYVVRQILYSQDYATWFELTGEETQKVQELLTKKAEERPYRISEKP